MKLREMKLLIFDVLDHVVRNNDVKLGVRERQAFRANYLEVRREAIASLVLYVDAPHLIVGMKRSGDATVTTTDI